MRGLTHAQVATIGKAAALMRLHGEVASEFELETIVDVCRRFRAAGRNTVVTEAEWLVIAPAVAAMERAFDEAAQTDAQAA